MSLGFSALVAVSAVEREGWMFGFVRLL